MKLSYSIYVINVDNKASGVKGQPSGRRGREHGSVISIGGRNDFIQGAIIPIHHADCLSVCHMFAPYIWHESEEVSLMNL